MPVAVWCLAITLVSPLVSVGSADEVATWGGFQNGGKPQATASLPVEWSPEENMAWSAAIEGYGQSAPVVAHDQVVVTATSGEQKEQYHVAAYAIESGARRWQVTRPNPSPQANTSMVSRAAPTAIATERGFIAFFEGGLLIALTPDGKVRWERDLVKAFGKIEARHGLAASLEQNAEDVFVWVERQEDPYLLALDKQTGEVHWRVAGVGKTSWASPRLVPVGEEPHLVCSASGLIVGFDPADGSRLWEFRSIANNTSCTPMPVGDGRFLIGASDGRGETTAGAAAESNGLIRIAPRDDGSYAVDYQWRSEKATSTFGSPVVAGETAAIVNRAGVLYRLDLETGEQVAAQRTAAGGIWATPIVVGDLLYLFGHQGTTSVISLSDGKEIAENRCWEAGAETSAIRGGNVLYAAIPAAPYWMVRRGDRLFAIKGSSTP